MQPWATAFVSRASLLTNKPTWPYLSYVVSTHLFLTSYLPATMMLHPPTYAGSLLCTWPQAWVPHALWHSWPSFSQGLGGWIQLPKGCRAAWSPDSKTCLARGSTGSSMTVAVTLDLKWKCSWRDNCSRKQKGQGQRCLFHVAEIFCLSQRQHVKNPQILQLLLGEGICQRENKLTLKKLH